MTNTMDGYLQSPQAMEDVARMAPWISHGAGMQGAWCLSCTSDLIWSKMRAEDDKLWRPGAHWVYIRKERACFIVTDLGEGLRTYAMRT